MPDYNFPKRICKTCGIEFQPKCDINVFCCRRCFKKDYYHRKKAEEIKVQAFPIFNCPSCHEQIYLDFDPTKNTFRWLHFVCPKCQERMINISERIDTGIDLTSG